MRQSIVVIPQQTRTEYVTRTIHEHRAPTDESVRLLKEFEEKAVQKIVKSVHIADTALECVVHTALDCMNDCTRLMAVFSLNGQKETAEVKYRPRHGQSETDGAILLRDEVAKIIANKMIAVAFSKLNGETVRR